MRPSAHHDGTDPPRLAFDARLEKRKTGRRVAAGRFRSCLTTPQITSVRSDLASSRGGCQSAWRGRHAKRCTGQLRIITAVRRTKFWWRCDRRQKRQSWCRFEVKSRLRAYRACPASSLCAPPARSHTAAVRFPVLRYDISCLSFVLRRDGRRISSSLLGWPAVSAIRASIVALGLVSARMIIRERSAACDHHLY